MALSLATTTDFEQPAALSRTAVIDIGSNSIRLVVFEGNRRAPVPIFNEKVICGLGQRLGSTGRLDPDGVRLALDNLARFKAAADGMGVESIITVATSAVRDAEDGAAFVRSVERDTGLAVDILSGEDEARLGGMGILSAFPKAEGLLGDLGGGSLEIVRLAGGDIHEHATLPLGALRLNEVAAAGGDIKATIKSALGELDWLKNIEGQELYVVGGAWRALARVHLAQRRYSLQVLDNYTVQPRAFRDFAKIIGQQSDAALAKLPNFPVKRLNTVRPGALVLRQLIKVAAPRSLIFSAQGLREGLLFDRLPAGMRQEDPLHAACAGISDRFGRFKHLGPALARWIAPILADESEDEARLRLAACLLGDIGWIDHPDARARLAFDRTMTIPVAGLNHKARAFLAHVIHARYGGLEDKTTVKVAERIGLDEPEIGRARSLGMAMRLGYTLSAGREEALAETALVRTNAALTLLVPPDHDYFRGESIRRRLKYVADSLGLASRVETDATALSAQPD